MNLFYEDYPKKIDVNGKSVAIVTDFREYIKLIDMLKDNDLVEQDKLLFLTEYFLDDLDDYEEALLKLSAFVQMYEVESDNATVYGKKKNLYSFNHDYAYILSAFMRDYGIDLNTIEYMHWWKFRALFDGLSEDTEIKQRIMYRGIDLSTIKDSEERKRIKKIQSAIMLPQEELTDYDIGAVFG